MADHLVATRTFALCFWYAVRMLLQGKIQDSGTLVVYELPFYLSLPPSSLPLKDVEN